MNKDDLILLVISIVLLFIGAFTIDQVEESYQNKRFLSNIPIEMVDYISSKLNVDSTTYSGRRAIKLYYLQNFNQLEDLAYEYGWY